MTRPTDEPQGERRLATRPDLIVSRDGETGFATVKDPVALEYFRLGPREARLLETLREPATPKQLARRWNEAHPTEQLTDGQAIAFCHTMHDCGLLTGPEAPTPQAAKRSDNGFHPLAIRLPGVDPSPLLNRLRPLEALFTTPAALLLLVVGLLVGSQVIGRSGEAMADLAKLTSLADPRYLVSAIVVLVASKAWHELGHAVACRRFGCECHEIGVTLLALIPCAYCDVSDAWTLKSRRARAAIALGGVYFEAILAIAAGAAWLLLAPGVARALAMHTIALTGLTTLLVNLNPLVRFDGYYLLADAWGVPNLHTQSRRALWGPVSNWIVGRKSSGPPLDASPKLLRAYGAASAAYLTMVLVLIGAGFYLAAARFGLQAPAGWVLVGAATWMAFSLSKSMRNLLGAAAPGQKPIAFSRLAGLVAVSGAVAWAVLGTPREQSLRSPCRVEGVQSTALTAPFAGELVSLVAYDASVSSAEPVARIEDVATDLRRLQLIEELAGAESRHESATKLAVRDAGLLAEVAKSRTEVAELKRQLADEDQRRAFATLQAPFAGRVTRPPQAPEPLTGDETADGELPRWTGSPLDSVNDGCWVEAGEPIAVVAGEEVRAVVLLDQQDSALVSVGDPVRIVLDRRPGERLTGSVTSISLASASEASARPRDSDDVAAEAALRDPLGEAAAFRVAVQLDGSPQLQHGALGKARIVTGEETVLGGLWRLARAQMRWTTLVPQ